MWDMIRMSPHLFDSCFKSTQNSSSSTTVPLHPGHCGLERKIYFKIGRGPDNLTICIGINEQNSDPLVHIKLKFTYIEEKTTSETSTDIILALQFLCSQLENLLSEGPSNYSKIVLVY